MNQIAPDRWGAALFWHCCLGDLNPDPSFIRQAAGRWAYFLVLRRLAQGRPLCGL